MAIERNPKLQIITQDFQKTINTTADVLGSFRQTLQPIMILPLLLIISSVSSVLAAPQLELGSTTLTGTDIPGFGVEFFGGKSRWS